MSWRRPRLPPGKGDLNHWASQELLGVSGWAAQPLRRGKSKCLCLTETEFDFHFKPRFCWVIETQSQAVLGFLWHYTEQYEIAAVWSSLNKKMEIVCDFSIFQQHHSQGWVDAPGAGVPTMRGHARKWGAHVRGVGGTWSRVTAHSACPWDVLAVLGFLSLVHEDLSCIFKDRHSEAWDPHMPLWCVWNVCAKPLLSRCLNTLTLLVLKPLSPPLSATSLLLPNLLFLA